jgi:dienelactone hydrolase
MSLRRHGPLALAFASLVACHDVHQEAPKSQIVIASFVSPDIPTPNDLALQATPTLPAGAQKDLLQAFVNGGGFPSDQEVAVTVPFRSMAWNESTRAYEPAAVPDLDLATVTPSTAVVLKVDGGAAAVVDTEAGGFANGKLTLRKKADATGSRRWAPGRYVIAVRGGANGVKTTAASGALPVAPDQAIALILENKDLTNKENQPPGGLPTALVTQLETLRSLYWNPITWGPRSGLWAPAPSASVVPAFPAVDAAFPHAEVAALATFGVAPAALTALTDSGSGQIPLPSTFLLDGSRPVPDQVDRYYVRNVSAFGPAAAGLATLDGFSTTGLMLAPLSAPAAAATITSDSVLLFELPTRAQAQAGAVPRRMRDVRLALGAGAPQTAEYLTQPPALNRTVQVGGADVAVTTAIGLQPGVPVPVPPPVNTIVFTPPLKEKANYLVVITDGVKDLAGQPIRRSTLANILFTLEHPPVDAQGHSTLSGVPDADAQALYALRTNLDPVLTNIGALSGTSLTKDNVVMAYTVQTQTVTDVSVGLSALPYKSPTAFAGQAPATLDVTTLGFPADAMTTFFPAVDSFITAMMPTVDAINPATGALNPDTTKWAPTAIPALVAVPKCPTGCLAPLVVWLHGQGGSHWHMLTTANALAAKGFVVAAVDMPYHGDRAFCAKNSDCTTDGTADGVCTPDQAKAGQGDAVPPGTCTTGHLRGTNLTTVASGNYFLSSNFFRTRDIIRQQMIDQSALALALARPLAPFPQPSADPLKDALTARGVGVDPTHVYFVGHSQGGETGPLVLATNPRFSRGALNAVGGTMVDIFTSAPAFQSTVDALFSSIGIDRSKIATDPAVASKYLQTLILMKWILDPAEPINYARNIEQKLPSPLLAAPPAGLGGTPYTSPGTQVLGQLITCDQKVTNATTLVNGVPQPYGDLLLALGGVDKTFYASASATNGCVPHGVAIDTFAALSGGTSIGDQLREDAAQFLSNLTNPGPTVLLP